MNLEKQTYPIYFVTSQNDFNTLSLNINYIKTSFKECELYIVSTSKIRNYVLDLGLKFIDENKIFEKMTLETIAEIMQIRGVETKRAGWYFQQFIKMGISYITDSEYYFICDSDTVLLKDFVFYPPHFDVKSEYNEAYFTTLNRLFPDLNKKYNFSFISEHMLIKTSIMKELINNIEKNVRLTGNSFFEKIIYQIDIEALNGSGFSEFETYGNYVLEYYPNLYVINSWKSLRENNNWLPCNKFSKHMKKWLSKDFDAISFDKWQKYSNKKYIFYVFFSYLNFNFKHTEKLYNFFSYIKTNLLKKKKLYNI